MILKHRVNNFEHRVGHHCESSALRDLFEFYGFPMSEALVFGLDATMGFGFFDTTEKVSFIPESEIPFFLGGKQGTIEPNSLTCRLLGISLRKQSFTSANKGWEEAIKLIDENVPLILRIDMGFLPYYEFKEDYHFGGHTITLAGYDNERNIAFVGDTDHEGFQEVSIEKLKNGRSSTYGPSFMHPKNTQYSMKSRPDGKHPPLGAGVKLAIQKVVNNMLRPSTSNVGIQGIKMFAESIKEWDKKIINLISKSSKKVASPQLIFDLTYGNIETWGTGGALFRNLYVQFLEELQNHPELKNGPRAWNTAEFKLLDDSILYIKDSAQNWTAIAETLKDAADNFKNDCINQVNFPKLSEMAHKIVSLEEMGFKKLSKLKI
ncbi:hypothetical protein LCGC14_1090830 [marine sediment metagenome]|uniref:Butirosin biosynthesis protein H N-terminal domain-containing protein n=1 Tax=marine sediment metagenome TaxID=412755 RepID=A0A0F9MCH4_9ZZZZ|nr:DUF4872 domain-containing protein [bacterium]